MEHPAARSFTLVYVENDPSWSRLVRASLLKHLGHRFPDVSFDLVTLQTHAELEQALGGSKIQPTTIYGHGEARTVKPDLIITDNMAPIRHEANGKKKGETPAGYDWIAQRSPDVAKIPCIMFSDGALDALLPALAPHGVPLVPKHLGTDYNAPMELACQIGVSLGLAAPAPRRHTEFVRSKEKPRGR
jgi:hypothetical protein